VDSDLDWGQDFSRLARRLHALGATEVHFGTLVQADLEAVQGFPPVRSIDPLSPAPGWTAVSPTWWKLRQFESEMNPFAPASAVLGGSRQACRACRVDSAVSFLKMKAGCLLAIVSAWDTLRAVVRLPEAAAKTIRKSPGYLTVRATV
jgi:hypothetical protein